MLPITVFVGFVLVGSIFLSNWLTKNSARVQGKSLPGPINLPFFGCFLEVGYLSKTRKFRSFQVFEYFCKRYGSIVGLQIGLQYTVVVEDFEMAKQILNSEDWQGRNPEYSPYRALTFDKQVGLMFAYGEGWRENRRFVLRTLKDVGFGLKNKLELDLTEEISHFFRNFDAKRLAGNDDVSMHRVFKLASLNMLWRTLCGTRCSENDEFIMYMIGRVEDTVQSMGVGCEFQYAFPFLSKIPGLTDQQYQIDGITLLHDYFKGILEERRKLGDYKTNPQDFIGYYLKRIDTAIENGEKNVVFNDEQLIQSCSDMFLAGADTTGNSMEFAILYMAKFSEVQRKVQSEIDRVIPKGQLPLYSDTERMPYTQAVLLESMRHATITPIIPRTSITQTQIKNCNVPKNTVALINFYKINHDKSVFGDPETFRPERFLDSDGNLLKDSSTQFLQFGLGRRICVGMPLAKASFFTFFANFFNRYSIGPSLLHPNLSLDSVVTGINNQPLPFHCLVKLRKPF